MTNEGTRPDPAAAAPRRSRMGLSGRLLLLTALFVMIAEVLIYVPSIANFRLNWLKDRLAAAHTAALVLEPGDNRVVSDALVRRVLDSIGAQAVALKMGNHRRLLALSENPPMVHQEVDVRDTSTWDAIMGAFETIFMSRDRDVLRAVGPAPMGGDCSAYRFRTCAARVSSRAATAVAASAMTRLTSTGGSRGDAADRRASSR